MIFNPSRTFKVVPPVVPPILPEAGAQEGNGVRSSGAIAGGVTGLFVIAALLLLLLWFKKKKKEELDEEPVEPETVTLTTEALNDDMKFISEYGLSDKVPAPGGVSDHDDLPVNPDRAGYNGSDEMNASEHNPDEMDDF
jgi:hypothetical protein